MIIWKRPDPLDDHSQGAGSSRWSFARGWILRMIICKWPDPQDDHLHFQGRYCHSWKDVTRAQGCRLRRKMKKILVATTWSVLLVARKTRRSVWKMSGLSQVFLPAMETLMKLRSRDSVLSAFFCPGLVLESGLWGMASIQEPRNSVMMKLAIIAEIGN